MPLAFSLRSNPNLYGVSTIDLPFRLMVNGTLTNAATFPLTRAGRYEIKAVVNDRLISQPIVLTVREPAQAVHRLGFQVFNDQIRANNTGEVLCRVVVFDNTGSGLGLSYSSQQVQLLVNGKPYNGRYFKTDQMGRSILYRCVPMG